MKKDSHNFAFYLVDVVRTTFKKNLMLIPGFLTGLLWVLHDFPARMSSDSIDSWSQVINGNYSNAHPVMFTFYVKILSVNGQFVWLVPIFQIVFALFMLKTFFSLWKLRNYEITILISLCMFIPIFGPFLTTIWKDVPLAIFAFWGFVLAKQFIESGKRREIVFSTLLISLGISFRHNGWLIVLGVIFLYGVVILIGKSVKREKVFVVSLFIAIFTSQVASQLLIISTDAIRVPKYAYSLTFGADLAYISEIHPDEVNVKIKNLVRTFSQGDSLEGAKNCTAVGYMTQPVGFDPSGLEANSREVVSAWIEVFRGNPGLIISTRVCRALAFVPPPFISHPVHATWLFDGIYEPNDFGLVSKKLKSPITDFMDGWLDLWVKYALIVAWPALLGLIGTILLPIISKLRHSPNYITNRPLVILVWSNLLTLVAMTPSPDFRYAAIAQFFGITCILVFSITMFKKVLSYFK
jgi:hypothetical protein